MNGSEWACAVAGSALIFAALPAKALARTALDAPADEIVVYGRAIAQIGIASTGSEGVVGYEDFEKRPVSRVGELAENVPGLIATQHSGEGKANQYFLRGFNLDHGTDLAGFVDGAPVNMRTHGHGQGYLDLNSLIPEMVERIDYRKGPYHADQGDFTAAGSMAYTTKSRLAAPIVELTGGNWGYWRALAAGSADIGGSGTLLAALDGTLSNGPWTLDDDLRKLNGLVKYSGRDWSLGLSAYAGRWNATDQVPQRAIENRLIPRLGHIDPTLGGRSARAALNFNGRFGDTGVSAYAIGSSFRLISNFTYFLDDPVDGDEFQQKDERGIFGGSIAHALRGRIGSVPVVWRIGADTRYDRIGRVGLYRSKAGVVTGTIRQDRVDEYSGGLFGEARLALTPALRLILGLRGDALGYDVASETAANSGSGSAAFLAPKAALAWKAAQGLELYADYGESYHSNDVRGAAITVDPASGDPADKVPVFVRARGAELGARVEQSGFTASLVGFWLHIGSELVFVGDAGSTEPNDASERFGTELALFWRPAARWLTLDASAAFTHTRFKGVAAGQDHIPNAVPHVLAGGISAEVAKSLTLTARLRHFGAAPLIEDNSRRSNPTTLVNAGLYWSRGPVLLSADLLNAFDAKDADISYFYASRLPGEPAEGVADRHIHPAEPRQIRVTMRYRF
jgi:hypothetical protein